MDVLHITIPLGDGVSIDNIPEKIKESARNTVKMWEDFFEKENERRIEKLKIQIETLRAQIDSDRSLPPYD